MTLTTPPPPVGRLSAERLRRSGRFDEPEESAYHERKFDELRGYTWRTMLALPPLILGLWAWDWVIDAGAALDTLWPRIGMAACLIPCILVIRSPRITLGRYTLLLYASVLATEGFWLAILRRLEGGMVYGIGGYMYYVLGMLVVGLPLRFRDNTMGLSLALLLPDVAAAAGWLPGFSLAKYNTLVLPAGALSLFTMWAFDRLYRRLFSYQRGVEQLAGEDPLTALPNRRQFMNAGERTVEQVRRYGRTASLLVIDLDHFKAINDRYGHAAGDAALQAVARLLREHQRAADLPARVGGEEFAMLLPETEVAGAVALAERLRAACEALRIQVPGGVFAPLTVTMSVGVAECGAQDRSLDDVLRRADAALYRAKHGGRNRVGQ
ncbi:MAG TPA: GGDEF domain-containing protein [Gemmatimonadales bacterium]